MTLRTGNRPDRIDRGQPRRCRALTLIELILVMGVLAVVFSLAAPSLSRFFRGRTLDSEAKRFLSLTRYGQSRAISEGMPMVLWVDEEQRAYGLQAAFGYMETDTNAIRFELAERLEIEVSAPALATSSSQWNRPPTPGTVQLMGTVDTPRGLADLPVIRFLPSGFIGESSPQSVGIREGKDGTLWIGLSGNRLNYEMQTNQPADLRRY